MVWTMQLGHSVPGATESDEVAVSGTSLFVMAVLMSAAQLPRATCVASFVLRLRTLALVAEWRPPVLGKSIARM